MSSSEVPGLPGSSNAPLDISNDHSATTALIERATGLTIHTYEVINTGAENLIIEVNDEWVFRLPRDRSLGTKDRKQLNFLTSFSKRSPLAVPDPVYVTDDLVGYKKIPGSPLYPTQIELLPWEGKEQISKQLGLFLATLHHYQDETIDFHTGYLGAGVDQSCPQAFARYLRPSEIRKLEAKLKAIADNPANFVDPTTIIHGDLYFANILWDPTNWVVTGIVDWSALGRGLPAMDFIALADFTDNRNDQFLRQILRWYGGDDGLFNQVKEWAIIEVLNWYWWYEARKDSKGEARTVERLKRILNT
jgi:aminoglycoside phosphotransferase (APT) family kinase protein